MLPAQFTTLWLGDPVAGVINFGSGACIGWLLMACSSSPRSPRSTSTTPMRMLPEPAHAGR